MPNIMLNNRLIDVNVTNSGDSPPTKPRCAFEEDTPE